MQAPMTEDMASGTLEKPEVRVLDYPICIITT
jgi:hypothetical protein